ncbi:uncharacterized protein Z520_01699 [Fonsecaea multimorphosa CBS 102226]|uniref:Polynucleotide 5'-hydroxyl-kinase GRC3 n=1 Tax=Fonsecaea multimorphosa CBS 102226 TaxID=1442371 RepID=A0A0D2J1F9_9EURO|nr:uncharacterized protein Z520_01699 [Fonsecaea multimorphosa CBS 102226]KIY03232.1 hypothetical protein Z520_01699 [Fonsecaea multimorphosa CBS 102226]OAL30471.1 hypothetical protein AYO22_01669 [Fonsecaea multimorphosa]
MPANGGRLSAVARRRLLRDVQDAASSPGQVTPPPVSKAGLSEAPPLDQVVDNGSLSEDEGIRTPNQFATLVEASAVHFSSTREIEQLTDRSVKIKLSRGQKCVALGTYTLWVKQGSVSLYGAILTAATAIHRIYAPATHTLPSIEAVSSSAEVQLESLNDGVRNLPYIGLRGMWTPFGVKPSAATFYVLGHSFEQDPKAPRRLKDLDITGWKSLLTGLSDDDTTKPRRVLMCGKRSSGLSTLIRCVFNRILAKQSARPDATHQKGVILLDLDTNMPEFAPPGMISLVHIAIPVFGPSFTNILPSSREGSIQILAKHFLGDLDARDLANWHFDRIFDLLDAEQKCRAEFEGAPVLVTYPKWLNGIDNTMASKLWAKLSPSDIVCLDSTPDSPHLEPWKLLAEAGNCRIHQIPAQVFDKTSPVREHDLQMQSYFHLRDTPINRPYWDDTPVLVTRTYSMALTYGGNAANVSAIMLLGGHVAPEDTYDALEGSIVAVLALTPHAVPKAPGDLIANSNDSHRSGIYRTEEDLPLWREHGDLESSFPFPAECSRCLGLAIVQEIDIPKRKITLITAAELQVHEIQEQGHPVALVVPKATTDGRFKTDWAQREMHLKKNDSLVR